MRIALFAATSLFQPQLSHFPGVLHATPSLNRQSSVFVLSDISLPSLFLPHPVDHGNAGGISDWTKITPPICAGSGYCCEEGCQIPVVHSPDPVTVCWRHIQDLIVELVAITAFRELRHFHADTGFIVRAAGKCPGITFQHGHRTASLPVAEPSDPCSRIPVR